MNPLEMADTICTHLNPTLSVRKPPSSAPHTEPTPNKVMINPASASERPSFTVTYRLIKGTAMVPALLISITRLSNQVSRLSPENDTLYEWITLLIIKGAKVGFPAVPVISFPKLPVFLPAVPTAFPGFPAPLSFFANQGYRALIPPLFLRDVG